MFTQCNAALRSLQFISKGQHKSCECVICGFHYMTNRWLYFIFFFFSKQQIWIFKCGGWKMTSNYANKGSCMSGHVPLDKLQPWASFTCKRRMTRGTSESKCADWWMLPGLFWMRLSAQKGTSLDLFIALDLNVIRAVISLVTWLPLFFQWNSIKITSQVETILSSSLFFEKFSQNRRFSSKKGDAHQNANFSPFSRSFN